MEQQDNTKSEAPLVVSHDLNEQKFYAVINNEEAFVSYCLPDTGRIHFITTFVPFQSRGKGVARRLVEEAMNFAKENNLAISTSCWYIKNFIARNKRQSAEQK